MAGGRQTFKKRQKEQQRKERQEEKFAKRLQRKREPASTESDIAAPEDQDRIPSEGDQTVANEVDHA